MYRYFVFLIIFLQACASIQPLSGGEKDITPPQVLSVTPDSAQLNVQSNIIIFQFDEYIKTKNVNQLLLISPQQTKPPQLEIKGKKAILTLKDSLLPNTTYSIQFNGSIVDNNEGNELIDYNYLFSTGTFIDSLSRSGVVINYKTKERCESCNVHLYPTSLSDSSIFKNKPNYITRTDKQGNYTFNNLPEADLKLLALKDENKNLLYDIEEQVSFDKTINTNTSEQDTLNIFKNKDNGKVTFKLVPQSIPGIIKIIPSRSIDVDSPHISINTQSYNYTFSTLKDTITLYNKPTDTSIITIEYLDDTTTLTKIIETNKLKYTIEPKVTLSTEILTITSKIPIKEFDIKKVHLTSNSKDIHLVKLSQTPLVVKLKTSQILEDKAQVILDKFLITDVLSKTNNIDTFNLTVTELPNTLLTINIELQDSAALYILSLQKGSNIIKTKYIKTSQKINYKNLKPSSYKLVIIKDINKNNIWDSGDIFNEILPEPRKLSKEFEVRENWDKELKISL